jgi:hypothetical protein
MRRRHTKFVALSALRYVPAPVPLEPVLTFLDRIATDASMPLEKSDIASQIASVVPGFRHIETGRNLDDRT